MSNLNDANTTMLDQLGLLMRHRRLIIGLPLICTVLLVTRAVTKEKRYTAESRFGAQAAPQGTSRLRGIAAQFGVDVNAFGAENESVSFYAELVKMPDLLGSVATTPFEVQTKTGPSRQNLIQHYGITGETERERVRRAVERLQRDVAVSPQISTGLVTLSTTAPSPELAVQINRRILQLVDEFNQRKRQSSARAEREFVESRLREAKKELSDAENAYAAFRQRNRAYVDASSLRVEEAALQRRVSIATSVYTSLAQNFEEVRINEVRNTPVVTLVTQPENWVRRSGRGPVDAALLGLLFGLSLALGWIYIGDYLRRQRDTDPQAWSTFIGTIRNIPLLGRLAR